MKSEKLVDHFRENRSLIYVSDKFSGKQLLEAQVSNRFPRKTNYRCVYAKTTVGIRHLIFPANRVEPRPGNSRA